MVSIRSSDSSERADNLRVLTLLFGILFDVVKSEFFHLRVPNDLHIVDFGAIGFYSIFQCFYHLGFYQVVRLLNQLSKMECH